MNKCPVCIVGNLKEAGSYSRCMGCGFTIFVITQDYIDACCRVLGVLLSNGGSSKDALDLIKLHLPLLADWIVTVDEDIIPVLLGYAKAHAINMEDEEPSMQCRCGNTEHFTRGDLLTQLSCDECGAEFLMEPGESFKPIFQCKCGCITYQVLDPESTTLIVACSDCSSMFVKDQVNDTFMEMG